MINTIGSVCSGIEAASVAWKSFGVDFKWFSEIAPFPSKFLAEKYPTIPNLGDMTNIPDLILKRKIVAPDMICGGTPCQAFSLAGWKNGLNDDRGNLTLKFVDIVNSNDIIRLKDGKNRCKVFWENVEGVLTDKTNAFGCFISYLAGLDDVLSVKGGKWPNSGLVYGSIRNVAWRVLDAKYFGVPQQRRRLYVIAGDKNFHPENILFELHKNKIPNYPSYPLVFTKNGHKFEVFREYTDCLYSSYGTKWNGNAAAYNGSLFIVQDNRIRRLSPLESERLMGLPDDYTNICGARKTNRYQVIGNSWAIPVVKWIGKRIIFESENDFNFDKNDSALIDRVTNISDTEVFFNFDKDIVQLSNNRSINCTAIPEKCEFSSMEKIVSVDVPEDIYISPVGCYGIIRRKTERNLKINPRLEKILSSVANKMSLEEIEKKSRIQSRGRFSVLNTKDNVLSNLLNDKKTSKSDTIKRKSKLEVKNTCKKVLFKETLSEQLSLF
ncbi:DNA cytosine methyltransferase [Megamonas hypermegale]|uniref:DNA cytosine methyltransferase n=1 Tax=Megamonas hypermegale TaxID=158847 RepID=UPI00195E4F9A|nr:DNA cytosine methyltransferase [Megamonas hypermegale]MBM6832630.1 DNA cytosine methyltransferase [Megamonas hypermegale]